MSQSLLRGHWRLAICGVVVSLLVACSDGHAGFDRMDPDIAGATAVEATTGGAGSPGSTGVTGSGTGGATNLAGGSGGGGVGGSGTAAGGNGTAVGGSGAMGGSGSSAGFGGSAGSQSPQGGGNSMGGSAGSAAYDPCPTDGNPCLILPFGDSITDGVGSTDLAGYRSPLFKLIAQANQKATFVGSRNSGPDQVANIPFPKNHEGHPGWTIDSGYVSFGDGISTLIPTPAFKVIPHIVLLMIGTNDVSASKGTDMIAERLDTLLGKIVQTAPKALVVVAQLTPIGWKPQAASSYNAEIPGIVSARVGKGQHMVVVDMSKMPAANLNSDSLHPNDVGYAFMSGVWYAAIKGYLPS
jgi:GDSL-like Lipase/Acylhydrolase family